jgi:hypothetical protein
MSNFVCLSGWAGRLFLNHWQVKDWFDELMNDLNLILMPRLDSWWFFGTFRWPDQMTITWPLFSWRIHQGFKSGFWPLAFKSSSINVVVVAVWWLLVLVVGRLSVVWSMFVERCCH